MKKLYLLFIFHLLLLPATSAPIDLLQAKHIALKYLFGERNVQSEARNVQALQYVPQPTDAYYVFNIGPNKGFVIVSGEDNTNSVLGHVTSGTFDNEQLPDAFRWWLSCCENYVYNLRTVTNVTPTSEHQERVNIPGLVTTKWNQTNPYNSRCPKFDEALSVTGCVATAAAQIMRHHEWPKATTAVIPGYESKLQNYVQTLSPLAPRTFDWTAMKSSYGIDEDADEVAWLIRYVGQAMQMQYSPKESGSNVLVEAFHKYFDYVPTVREVDRSGYSEAKWQQLIYDELRGGRPVLYTGGKFDVNSKIIGYHAFVCHGYVDGKFLINWGWGGLSDGAFDLSVLNPSAQGTGSFAGASGYTIHQAVILGIQPNNVSDEALHTTLFVSNVTGVKEEYLLDHNTQMFDFGHINVSIFANNQHSESVSVGWQLRDEDNQPVENYPIMGQFKIENLPSNNKTIDEVSKRINIGNDLPEGTYYLVPMYVLESDKTKQWQHFANQNVYIKFNYSRNKISTIVYGKGGNIVCHDKKYSETIEENKESKLELLLENKGIANAFTLYLFDETQGRSLGAVGIMLDAGAKATMTVPYVVGSAGVHKIGLYLDRERRELLTHILQKVSAAKDAELTQSSPKVKNAKGRVVTDSFDYQVTIENWADEAYENKIVAMLCDRNGSTIETIEQQVIIPADDKKKLNFAFSAMQDGEQYCVKVYYIKKNLLTRLSLANPVYYMYQVSDGIENIISKNKTLVDVYNLKGASVMKVRASAVEAALRLLPKGIYIIKGKKYIKY